jgi:NhaP-type Na+/H+ or K+/H+ antiporter
MSDPTIVGAYIGVVGAAIGAVLGAALGYGFTRLQGMGDAKKRHLNLLIALTAASIRYVV